MNDMEIGIVAIKDNRIKWFRHELAYFTLVYVK